VIGIAQLSTFWILALFPRRLPSGSKAVKAGKKIILQASKKSQRTLKGTHDKTYEAHHSNH
jgi:hypothetical protein